MHSFEGASDGVHGAGLQAEHTSNAVLLSDEGQLNWALLPTVWVEGQHRLSREVCELLNPRASPRGATIDWSLSRGHRLRVGKTGCEATPLALSLREDLIDEARALEQAVGPRSVGQTTGCFAF
ncbi:MAG: hypothetical protein RLY30_1510 [Pseudomonadota bacterium]|jgi:hypothetical protein